MRLNRFIGNFDLAEKKIEIKDSDIINQIKSVLRLGMSDHITLLDGKGREVEVEITSLSKNFIETKYIKEVESNKPKRKVHLYLAILKKENFELAVQKAVETGVSEIIPVITERTVKTGINTVRLEKIIKEACEQSGRSIVPKLHEIIELKDALQKVESLEEKVIFHLTDTEYTPNKTAKNISIFIGPEGGFTEKEVGLAKDSGFTVASLGPFVLRGETAAIVATYRAVQGL